MADCKIDDDQRLGRWSRLDDSQRLIYDSFSSYFIISYPGSPLRLCIGGKGSFRSTLGSRHQAGG
jgi:hypothetical protein